MASIGKKGEERRTLLVEAALDLFSKNGYDGTTTREVAEKAGVTEAVVFRYFPSKRELFGAVVAECGSRRELGPSEDERCIRPIGSVLRSSIGHYLDAFWANRAGLRMMILEAWRDPEVGRSLNDQFAEQRGQLERLLEERSTLGELRPNISAAAAEVIASATSGFLQRSLRTEPLDWDTARSVFIERLVVILLQGIEVDRSDETAFLAPNEAVRRH